MGLSVLARGSLHEKLQWAFNLYDINGKSSFAIQFPLDLNLKPFYTIKPIMKAVFLSAVNT